MARNPDGAESEPYPFLVESAPSPGLSGVSPADGRLGATVTLTVHGHDMFGRPALRLSPEEDPERVVGPLPLALVSPSRLVAEPLVLSADLFSLGRHLLWVENPDGAESNRVPFLVVE